MARGWAQTTPTCTNDLPCEAIDLGALNPAGVIGDWTLGRYSNDCAANIEEPQPIDFSNDAGVWFTFRTGFNPDPVLAIEAQGDPENTGQPLALELAVYRSGVGGCDNLTDLVRNRNLLREDNRLRYLLFCPEPDTRYYVLVDGQ